MLPPIVCLHHVTAMCGDPQRNVDFYAGVLGLRLVKRTVNFDDPSTYHLYYGDAVGSPGTLLTFFAWPSARRGRRGVGQVAVTALRIPASSASFWLDRLHTHQIVGVDVGKRDGATVISLADPDGMRLELVGTPEMDHAKELTDLWQGRFVPAEHAIRALHGITAELAATPQTAALLTDVMGLQPVDAEAGRRQRFRTVGSGIGAPSQFIELVTAPDERPGQVSVGFVHHIAWRVQDSATQAAWRERLVSLGYAVSPVIDRTYFHAIYFREPGGVLFEIATDPPGFTADGETLEDLGSRLQLPPQFEGQRAALEASLRPLQLPAAPASQQPSANE